MKNFVLNLLNDFHKASGYLLLKMLICCVVIFSSQLAARQDINYSITDNPTEELIVELMKLGFSKSPQGQSIQFRSQRLNVNEARKVQMLHDGLLDVIWTGTTAEYEQNLQAIRIPILKGMLGHRIFIIRSGEQARFSQIKSFAQLQKIPLGQGKFWGDTSVLKNAQMTVVDPVKYESLFHMLEGGRFDFFPRALHEPWSEVSSRQELNLTVEQNHLLIYPFALYFFVAKDNQTLAQQLSRGLMNAIEDGSYDSLFYNHPVIEETLARSALGERIVHRLENPNMSPETPVSDSRLWLDIKNF